jgi:peptide/nickel transport system substrate-binding protein
MIRTTWRLFAALFLLSLLLAACGGTGDPPAGDPPAADLPPVAAAGGTVTVAASSDIVGLNELLLPSTPLHSFIFVQSLFLPLLEEQPDYATGPPTFKPRLASSWEFSEDRKILTFHLRDNAVWSDDTPVTAEDVRWTWQAQTHPAVGWQVAVSKEHITDVEVVDAHTVRFHFDEIYSTQVMDAIEGVILPRHAWSQLPFEEWRENADWFRDHLVTNGPFTLESWEPQQRIVLARNERYFEPGVPRVDRVVVRIVPGGAPQLAMLEAGEIQIMDWARPQQALELKDNPDIALKSFVPRTFVSVIWNTANPLFESAKVRRAMTLAIDRKNIVDAVYHGHAEVTASPFTPDLWARNRDVEPLGYDPEQALELLAEEGWTDSDGDGVLDKDGKPFRFVLLNSTGNEVRVDTGLMIVEQLRQIGVEVEQQLLEFNTLVSREQAHDFEASFMGLSNPTDLNMSYFFHTDHIDGSFNFGSFSDPEMDRLLDEIAKQVHLLDAKPLLFELQVLIQKHQPMTFLYVAERMVPVRKELLGAEPNVLYGYGDVRQWALRAQPGNAAASTP